MSAKIQQQIGPSLLNDFNNQNVARLKEWFNRFPEAADILAREIGGAELKHALRENMWLSSAFLLRQPLLSKKGLQIQSASTNPHDACPLLIRAHVQGLDSARLSLVSYLHERARI